MVYVVISLAMVGHPDFNWTIHSIQPDLTTCLEAKTEKQTCLPAWKAYYVFDPVKPIRADLKEKK